MVAAAALLSACRFDETAVGGGVLTGHIYVERTRGLLKGEPVALRVVLREADDPADSIPPVPIVGHRLSIELEPLESGFQATVEPPTGTTGQDGGVTFIVDASTAGEVIVNAFAEPAGLDRVPLEPLALEFVATRPEMLVLERHDLPAGTQGLAVASGDLDGDDHDDLVLLDAGGTLYAWETGCLETVYTTAIGHPAVGLTMAEVTGDASEDVLVITRNQPHSLELLRSIGTNDTPLVFDPPAPLLTLDYLPLAITAGQLDGVGLPELVLRESSDTARVVPLSAPAAPAVTPGVGTVVPLEAPGASCIAVGRLDADELDDLVIGLGDLRQLQVLPGGAGRTAISLTLDVAPVALAIGEPSAGAPALLALVGTDASAQPALRVYRADAGVEGLAFTLVYSGATVHAIPVAVAVADLTTDGFADVAVLTRPSGAGEGALEVFAGLDPTLTAAPAFAAAAPHEVPEMPLGMVVGHWTWDAFLDVAVVSWGQPLTVFDGR